MHKGVVTRLLGELHKQEPHVAAAAAKVGNKRVKIEAGVNSILTGICLNEAQI